MMGITTVQSQPGCTGQIAEHCLKMKRLYQADYIFAVYISAARLHIKKS
jgi:hypothetical protein